MEVKILEQNVIVSAYATKGGINELFERVAQEVRKEVPDVTTDKGRKAIGSLAAKVSKSKKIIEDAGKALVADQKAQIKLIDDDRIAVVKMFDALRDEVLAPRDAWEKAEEDRLKKHEEFVSQINSYEQICINSDYSSIQVGGAILRLESVVIDESLQEFQDKAKLAKYEQLDKLKSLKLNLETEEAKQAELEKQRIAEQERLKRENEERIAKEAAEKATREAEEKARIEAERIENEKRQAIEKVEREKREAEQREAQLKAEKEAALLREAELKRQAEEQAKQAEIDRKNAIEAERLRIEQETKAKHDAEIAEAKKREADQAHKKQVCDLILAELDKLGIGAEIGKELIKAIHAKKIPNVTLVF